MLKDKACEVGASVMENGTDEENESF